MQHRSNIVIVGPPGAGKSTLGRRLAERLRLDFFDIDRLIESRLGVPIDTIFEKESEAGFRKREAAMLKEVLDTSTKGVIATGGGCILSAENRQRLRNERLVIYLDVEFETQLERVSRDSRRPLLQNVDIRQKLIEQRKVRVPLYESVSDLHLVSETLSFRDVEQQVRHALAKPS